MRYVGVDPGKAGAIAMLDEAGQVIELLVTPTVPAPKGGREDYDLVAVAAFFRSRADPRAPDRGLFVTVEKLQPLPAFRPRAKGGPPEPMGGTIANYNRGVARGWEWMLAAFRIPYQLVAPRTWQATMLAGAPGTDTGQRSIVVAKRLWPGTPLLRTRLSRKDDDGLSDALLLGEYGRRLRAGGHWLAPSHQGGV